MSDSVDVFRVETRGVRWLESVPSIESATARVQELAMNSPGEYLVLDQKTGNKYAIKLNGIQEPPG
jgi:hypothetical protein